MLYLNNLSPWGRQQGIKAPAVMQVPFSFQALAGDREGFFVRGYPSSVRTFVQSVAMGSAVFTWDLLMSSFLR